MDIEEFVEHFADQFLETDASIFTPETEFKTLEEWSSITALSVIAMVDDEYGITIKGKDVRDSKTILDLFNVVKGKA